MHPADAGQSCHSGPRRPGSSDPESAAWVDALKDRSGAEYELTCARLHALLVRIAMDDVFRRGCRYRITGPELNDLAHQAAADALMRITHKIHEFRGDARFTTWAFRFVVLEVSSKLSRHFWRLSTARFDQEEWAQVPDRSGVDPVSCCQAQELVEAVQEAVDTALTIRQRQVFTEVVLKGTPLETLADELKTNRNALYKTMFDARKKLRARLVAEGHLDAAG